MNNIRTLFWQKILVMGLLVLASSPVWALKGDITGEGRIDGLDLAWLSRAQGSQAGSPLYEALLDMNSDGYIDGQDLTLFDERFAVTVAPISEVHLPGEIIVRFKDNADPDQVLAGLQRDFQVQLAASSRFVPQVTVALPPQMEEEDFLASMARREGVLFAEPNYRYNLYAAPNDPDYPAQWNFQMIDAEGAWDIQTGSPEIIVAVVDTGIAYENYNLYCAAPDFAPGTFVPGWNVLAGNVHANDDDGHGTHVAGTIAEAVNNGIGATGLAFGCRLMPVKVCYPDEERGCPSDMVADGIRFAANTGAAVINLSLGGTGNSRTIANAVAFAAGKEVVMVAATGNDGKNQRNYPAAYPEVIAVGACDPDGRRSEFSNYGSYIDVLAPGGRNLSVPGIIQQTFPPSDGTLFPGRFCEFDSYGYVGTSMATPHVAALAALILSEGQVLRADEVGIIITHTARDAGLAGRDDETGYGIINAAKALAYDLPRGWN